MKQGFGVGTHDGATTQPVTADNAATGQVGGVNTAFTYASAGLGVGAVIIVCIVLFTNLFGDISGNRNVRAEIESHERIQLASIGAMKETSLAMIEWARGPHNG